MVHCKRIYNNCPSILQEITNNKEVMKPVSTQQVGEKSYEIHEKTTSFHNEIRRRQRQSLFNTIRKQYQTQIHQNCHQQIPNNSNNQQYTTQQYPLRSTTLQKYHELSHAQIANYLDQITQHLLEYNVYLSEFQKQSEEQEMHDEFFNDQQSLLAQDLFYLTIEHQGRFQFPRKFKFIRNGSSLVASYVAIVSTEVLPEELAYWVNFMNEEDRNILYLNVIGVAQMKYQSQKYVHSTKNFHYQTWINHPVLRNLLLEDFPQLQSAAKAVREIVGFRQVHPDRLKNSKGLNLYQILCNMLEDELQGMIEITESESTKTGKLQKCKLKTQHMEICVRVLQAKYLQNEQPHQLYQLLSKIISNRVQSQLVQISPLFCTWVVDALVKHQIYLLSGVGYEILINIMQYDPDKYSTSNQISHNKIRKQKLQQFYEMVLEKYPHIAEPRPENSDQQESLGSEPEQWQVNQRMQQQRN